MARKGFVDLAFTLEMAQKHANFENRTVRIWRRTNKDGTARFDILYLDETPRGEGGEMLKEVEPEKGER